jgi:hypothetical protein
MNIKGSKTQDKRMKKYVQIPFFSAVGFNRFGWI